MRVKQGEEQTSWPGTQHFMALPQPLLERILISNTSTRVKKALRQTCRQFRDTLDGRLSFTTLNMWAMVDDCRAESCFEGFLRRMQHMPCFKSVKIDAPYLLINGLLQQLPDQLTTLVIFGGAFYLKNPSCLTTLILKSQCKPDLSCITGLTRLVCCSNIGSVASLAPTLRHLSIDDYNDVSHLDKLTNLEVLQIEHHFPSKDCTMLRPLPLKHLCLRIPYGCRTLIGVLPQTLTCLTICNDISAVPGTLPDHITHLQLLEADLGHVIQLTRYFPGLTSLDLYMLAFPTESWATWNNDFKHISKLTNLKSLGLCIDVRSRESEDDYNSDPYSDGFYEVPLTREEILEGLPSIREVVDRGLNLNVVEGKGSFLGAFSEFYPHKSVWLTGN